MKFEFSHWSSKKILLFLFLLLTSCGPDCTHYKKCIKGHYETKVYMVRVGKMTMPQYYRTWVCDEYSETEIDPLPEGCK